MTSQQNLWDRLYKQNKNLWKKDSNLPKIFKNKKVLELGCGNGKTLKSIISQKPSSVSAIDFSQEAVKQAQVSFPNAIILKSDVTNLPFEENSFDLIVCHYILNNLKKEEQVLAVSEINRVLKSQGRVVFEDFAVGDFRQEKSNNKEIKCHFFSLEELKLLFKDFSNIKLKIIKSKPIHKKPNLERALISGIITK